jgi:uncharacterized membrane protein YfcA
MHKDSWPLLPLEWAGVFTIFIWIVGCLSGGSSGGGTLIFFLRVMFQFTAGNAIAISNTSIATGAIVSYILNFKKKHPFKKDTDGKPAGLLLDYNIAIIMMPMGIVGSAIGAIVPIVLPEPLIIAGLTISLAYVAVITIQKYVSSMAKEGQFYCKT